MASPVSDTILVINAGSATIKFTLYEVDAAANAPLLRYRGLVEQTEGQGRFTVSDARGMTMVDQMIVADDQTGTDPARLLHVALEWLEPHASGMQLIAAGHRVVHGGARHAAPVRIDDDIMAYLESLIPLAPLHQAHNLAAIRAIERWRSGIPQVACFDTAFHRTQTKAAQMYALPRHCWEEGIRAYGFHGISYEYIAGILPQYLGARADGRLIIAHLGGGASLCAIHNRRSVATTMGLTALDGLIMGTRCGAIDPGVVLHLIQAKKMGVAAVNDMLYRQSGLLGVSGLSADMRALLSSDAPAAAEAVDLFVHRAQRQIGSLAAALGGLDGIIFTGGIGENSAPIRERICRGLAWLGLQLDGPANQRGAPCISRPEASVAAWVLPTDEEVTIAGHTLALLDNTPVSRI